VDQNALFRRTIVELDAVEKGLGEAAVFNPDP
jgi:hypothetical protein